MAAPLQLPIQVVEQQVRQKRRGERGPPCGVPSTLGLSNPFSITPAFRNARINFKSRLSDTRRATRAISFDLALGRQRFGPSTRSLRASPLLSVVIASSIWLFCRLPLIESRRLLASSIYPSAGGAPFGPSTRLRQIYYALC